MSAEPKTIVVEISGPQASGKTTLAEMLTRYLNSVEVPVSCRSVGRLFGIMSGPVFVKRLKDLGTHVEVRETEYDDRDRELAGLRLRVPRLEQRIEALERENSLLAANQCDGPKVGDDGGNFHCKVVEDLKARYDRLLTAFHDATRRPMGVTPDTGLEFYDHRLADEAEARRTRYGRGPK